MEMSDADLVSLYRINPINVPIGMIGRCVRLLPEEDQTLLVRSVTRRRPRNAQERRILLHYAITKRVGGLLFIDALGGFKGPRPC